MQQVFNMRSKSPRCPWCTVISGGRIKGVAMKRLYIKEGNRFKAIGWICPICTHTIIEKTPIKTYKTAKTWKQETKEETKEEEKKKEIEEKIFKLIEKTLKAKEIIQKTKQKNKQLNNII